MTRRRPARRFVVAMKWKTMFSGQEACWRTEKTPATEPRRYVASRVMAMWIKEGLCEFLSIVEDHVVLGHSLPFRNAGASRNSGRSPEFIAFAAAKDCTVTAAVRKNKKKKRVLWL